MDLLPVSLYEYLFLFLLCFIAFLIGWFSGRRKKEPSVGNEAFQKDIDLEITTSEKELRAVQTRERGGGAVKQSATGPEDKDENIRNDLPEKHDPDEKD